MADLILKVTSEEVRNKAQEISTQRELFRRLYAGDAESGNESRIKLGSRFRK